jgi:MFS family permease
VIRRFPGARLGLIAVVISQTTMVAVMTMTPLHMRDHGQADLSAFVIALHIVGMYGLAPVVGIAADRLGRARVLQGGAAVLGLGTMVSVLAGYHPALIFTGLFLLGLGWSCGLIGGSTLLTESVPIHDRVAVQGAADLLMGIRGALGAVISGLVKAQLGFHMLANGATIARRSSCSSSPPAPAGRWPRRRPAAPVPRRDRIGRERFPPEVRRRDRPGMAGPLSQILARRPRRQGVRRGGPADTC